MRGKVKFELLFSEYLRDITALLQSEMINSAGLSALCVQMLGFVAGLLICAVFAVLLVSVASSGVIASAGIFSIALMYPAVTLFSNITFLMIYFSGIFILQSIGKSQNLPAFSDMIAAVSYAGLAIYAFYTLVYLLAMMPRVIASSRRINEVLSRDSRVSINHPVRSSKKNAVSSQMNQAHISLR